MRGATIQRLGVLATLVLVGAFAWWGAESVAPARAQGDDLFPPGVGPGDSEENAPEPEPARELDPALKRWAESVAERQPVTLSAPEAVRFNLLVDPSGEALYYTRADFPKQRPKDRALDLPERYTLCRLDFSGNERVLTDLGQYAGRFWLAGPGSLVTLRQHEDTDGDGVVTRRDARSLWLIDADSASATLVYAGDAQTGTALRLLGVLPFLKNALIGEPTEKPLSLKISLISLARKSTPVALTHGLWVECTEPGDAALIVSRVGRPPDPDQEPIGPWGRRGRQRASGPDLIRPLDHVRVTIPDGTESSILSGEEWYRVVFVHRGKAYYEVFDPNTVLEGIDIGAGVIPGRDRTRLLSQSMAARLDLENAARLPLTSDTQYDYELLAPLPDHGIAYLKNARITRYLMVYVDGNHHLTLHEFQRETAEFTLAPDGRTLYWLAVTDSTGDHQYEYWRDTSRIVTLPLD